MQIAALIDAGVAEDKIFIDEMSGAKKARERPAMVRLLDYARDGDEIYCWRIDRLGRFLVDVVNTVQEITDRGIKLHSIMDGVDPDPRPRAGCFRPVDFRCVLNRHVGAKKPRAPGGRSYRR
jgi:DNA invertase Pin-like site-specific DNA recombinase